MCQKWMHDGGPISSALLINITYSTLTLLTIRLLSGPIHVTFFTHLPTIGALSWNNLSSSRSGVSRGHTSGRDIKTIFISIFISRNAIIITYSSNFLESKEYCLLSIVTHHYVVVHSDRGIKCPC
jgi:hypothetical protein